MWMVAGINKKLDGPLGNYNVLTDKYLNSYFNNPSVRQHLIGLGLIRKDGSIIPESVYRRRHQEQMRKRLAHEALASAIVKKTIDLEKLRQSEIQKHLEDITKVETVERVRSAQAKRRSRSAPLLTTYRTPINATIPQRGKSSPTRSRTKHKIQAQRSKDKLDRWNKSTFNLEQTMDFRQFSNEDHFEIRKDASSPASSQSSEPPVRIPRSERPKSAHPKHRLKATAPPIVETIKRHFAQSANSALNKAVSPYLRPLLNPGEEPFVKIKPRSKSAHTQRHRGNSNRQPITIRELLDWSSDENVHKLLMGKKRKKKKTKKTKKSNKPIQTNDICYLTLRFLGNNTLKKICKMDRKHDVVVNQQHCGGTSIQIYKGKLSSGDTFTFPSHRHKTFPFSVTIFIDGIKDLRLSTCCEYRHQVKAKLGGCQGHFALISIDGGEPCIRCQVEKQLGMERPRHPVPREQTASKVAITPVSSPVPVLKEERIMDVHRPSSALQLSASKPDVIKIQPFSHQPDVHPDVPEVEEEIEPTPDDKDVSSDTSIKSECEKVDDDTKDLESSESLEEDIQPSGSWQIDRGASEDAVSGEYETAEFNQETSSEGEGEEGDEDEEESDEEVEEEDDGDDDDGEESVDDDVFVEEDSSTKVEQSEATGGNKNDNRVVVVRTTSAQNRISLPKSHWGARTPSLAPSYSSDEELEHAKKIQSVITADVHANQSASEAGSINSNCTSPYPPP